MCHQSDCYTSMPQFYVLDSRLMMPKGIRAALNPNSKPSRVRLDLAPGRPSVNAPSRLSPEIVASVCVAGV